MPKKTTPQNPDGGQLTLSKRGRPPGSDRTKTGLYVKSPDGLKFRSKKVHRLVQKLKTVLPWLEPSDLPAARSWAELELIGAAVFGELVKNGVMGEQNQSRRLLEDYRRLKLAQLAYERALGMVPVSRIALKALGKKDPYDLASAMAFGVGDAEEGKVSQDEEQ